MTAWSDPGANPIADIAGLLDSLIVAPNVGYISLRTYKIVTRSIARATLSKRAYRRWRGRQKQEFRTIAKEMNDA